MTDPALTRIALDDLTELLRQIFLRHNTRPETARILAENCAFCEANSGQSHGVFRMAGYVSSLDSGWVNGQAVARVEEAAPAFLRVDAMNGFAQPALEAARPALIDTVRRQGIAVLAIRNSHHLSALWPDVEPFAKEGMVALSMVNSMTCSTPFDAARPVFGTNPIAMAAPRRDGPPITFDLATSALAHGDVQLAARAGHSLPEGSGLDANGQPTTDPNKVLNGGALVPFGGHKGAAISLMVELLCAGLTGGNFSFEFDLKAHPGAHTPHTGQLFVVIDADRAGGAPFADRAETLMAQLRDAGMTRMPGDRRHIALQDSLAHGIALAPSILADLRAMAAGTAT